MGCSQCPLRSRGSQRRAMSKAEQTMSSAPAPNSSGASGSRAQLSLSSGSLGPSPPVSGGERTFPSHWVEGPCVFPAGPGLEQVHRAGFLRGQPSPKLGSHRGSAWGSPPAPSPAPSVRAHSCCPPDRSSFIPSTAAPGRLPIPPRLGSHAATSSGKPYALAGTCRGPSDLCPQVGSWRASKEPPLARISV